MASERTIIFRVVDNEPTLIKEIITDEDGRSILRIYSSNLVEETRIYPEEKHCCSEACHTDSCSPCRKGKCK